MEYEYVEATEELLERIWQKNIEKNKEDERWRKWKEEYISYHLSGKSKTFLVLFHGEPVGEGTLLFSEDCSAISGRKRLADGKELANINALRIEKEHEGKGHISALVRFMEQYALEHGFKKLTIGVEAKETRNLAIYLHWGYEEFVHSCVEEDSLVLYYAKQIDPMKLVIPTMEYAKEIQAFRQEFLEYGGSMDGCGSLRRFDNIQDWIDQVEQCKSKETTPESWVPMTQFIYVRESDGKIIGVIQIRHYLNDFLRDFAGHIGYSVCPSERRKGYATKMLHDILPHCRALGMDKILVSCLVENEGSRKTILNNGGVYFETVHEPKEDVWLEKYWIHTGI